jgi:hypothetical protein
MQEGRKGGKMEQVNAQNAIKVATRLPSKLAHGAYKIASVAFNQLARRDRDLMRIREGIDALERHETAPQDAQIAELYDLVYAKVAEDKRAGRRANSVKLPK